MVPTGVSGWVSDAPAVRVAAEDCVDAGGRDRKRCDRWCTWGVHNNVRKKIARGYQNGHERRVRRRNVRYSRRSLQHLHLLHRHAGGISGR